MRKLFRTLNWNLEFGTCVKKDILLYLSFNKRMWNYIFKSRYLRYVKLINCIAVQQYLTLLNAILNSPTAKLWNLLYLHIHFKMKVWCSWSISMAWSRHNSKKFGTVLRSRNERKVPGIFCNETLKCTQVATT